MDAINTQEASVKQTMPKSPQFSWADAADSDGETCMPDAASDISEKCVSPAVTWRPSDTFALNAQAPAFIPTLSMVCPLVGVYVMQGTPAQAYGEDPQQWRRGKKQAWRNAPQEWTVIPEVTEDVWEDRIAYRYKVLDLLEKRLVRLTQTAALEKSHAGWAQDDKPDPENRYMSRRQWRKAADDWFKAQCLQWELSGSAVSTTEERPNSVVSMEECISTNDGDSECGDY